MTAGDRVKFKTNGGWYNSGIIISMDEKTCLVEVDTLGRDDHHMSFPYYVRAFRDVLIPEYEKAEREDKNMTNYEWLIKNKADLVKDLLTSGLSKEKGIPGRCERTLCIKCDFEGPFCSTNSRKWLDEKREPLYKKGDIVVNHDNIILIVKEDYYDGDFIMVSRYIDNSVTLNEPISIIKKKVGHIEESEDNNDC